ncbi:hypothetical protein B1757_11770 [Acidithiobacillus marinus]|uniref:Diguanylate cyclase n=1 Tax=Acidithiobacillus marinus TaxID=187490 RepID=A0A2I1DJB3_9PROT|nr:EAL domain-containing protein [Acidithiobacillus marinus]PKY09966.1 hypothetical protein B1757_11770 [Acidithiobacillus marinus]
MKYFAAIQLPPRGISLSLRQIIGLNIGLLLGHVLFTIFADLLFRHSLAGPFWPIWPAAGVTAYGLLVWGPRVIPGLWIAAWLGGYLFTHLHADVATWFACSEVLGAWLGRVLLRRFSPDWAGLQSIRQTIAYLLLFVAIPSLLTAVLTGAGGWLLTNAASVVSASIPHLILFWAMANAGAILNVTALLLILLHGNRLQRSTLDYRFLLLASAALTAIVLLFFMNYSTGNLAMGAVFLLILPFLWLLANYPAKLVYPLASLAYLLALLGTSMGYGPYEHSRMLYPETMAQIVGLLLESIGLIAAAMMYERSHATQALEIANRNLEQRVFSRSQDLQTRNRELQVRDAFLQSVTEVNRLFAAIETQELPRVLDRFCNILVERMRLAAAWIGVVDEQSGRIELAAKAGELAGPLSQLQLYCWPSDEIPQSPSGRAIMENRTLLFGANDPLFTPWQELIKKHRMGGSIYTPFSWADGRRGVIALYRYDDMVFPTAIIELLERLSEDLAAFLRQRQVVRQLEDARILQKTMLVSGDIALQARDASQMLQQICDALIQSGLFNAAFIIRPNTEGVFQALALAGHHVDWILKRRWTIHPEDIPDGQSLTSQAWRMREHRVIQDYLKVLGPHADWYQEAEEHQWRSAATFPIYHQQNCWAMLNVIGPRPDLFNSEIIEVLQQIALLVGHGLDEIHLKGELMDERLRQSHLARHDALTGLANRRGFTEFLHPAMTRARRNDRMLAVAMLDLDDFKPINDQFGHASGDLLLQAVAKRLQQGLRQSDYLARLGGDEFVLVWDNLQKPEQISPIMEKIREKLAAPYFLGDLPGIHVGISAGITFYPLSEYDDSDADLLLRKADHALYQSKQNKSRRDQFWCAFAESQKAEHLRIQTLLHEGKMVLQYQPVHDLRQERIVGVEALARLNSKAEAISPGEFLPFLEPEDQWRLTQLVLTQIAEDWQSWKKNGIDLWVSLNILPSFLTHSLALERLQKLLAACAVPPQSLILEILESEELRSLEFSAESIRSLQKQGYRIGLDDVGAGYASLLYLKELPVDEIKIDQAFVRNLGKNPNDLHFLRAMLDIGNSQGVEIIVEGVENQSILNVLRLMQAPMLQGYAVALPMWASDLPDWMARCPLFVPEPIARRFDLLQLYAQVIDHQKTISTLLINNPHWFVQLAPWDNAHCPIQQSLHHLKHMDLSEFAAAHHHYHEMLEELTQLLSSKPLIDLYPLQCQGEIVLQAISSAMRRYPDS